MRSRIKEKGRFLNEVPALDLFWLVVRDYKSVRLRLKVDGSIFAALIDLDIEIEPVALIEIAHARTLDSADVHECIRLAVIALDEAEALHRVEELDRAARALTGELTARTTVSTTITAAETTRTGFARFARTVRNRKRFAFDLEIGRGNLATAIDEREAERLALGQAGEACLLNRADVDEDVFSAVIAHDEAEALLTIEEFYDARTFADNLSRHATTGTTTTATAAETAATACAVTKATAATEATTITKAATITKTAAKTSAALIRETAKIVAAETIPLVSAAPAASPVETHP